jgi:hypothetical protein
MPTIPVIPANAGGAGIGSLNKAKINPTKNPVTNDKMTIFMKSPLLMKLNLCYM